jgi:hypothetical protein
MSAIGIYRQHPGSGMKKPRPREVWTRPGQGTSDTNLEGVWRLGNWQELQGIVSDKRPALVS